MPSEDIIDFTKHYEARTAIQTSLVLKQASTLLSGPKGVKLKEHGLRNVQVSLFTSFILQLEANDHPQNAIAEIAHSDPHRALAPDRLHVFHGGVFPHHLWEQLKRHINALPRAAAKVDTQ